MTTTPPHINYILIDFENVQPTDFSLLKGIPFSVKIFLGPTQTKIPVSLAMELQALGKNAEYLPLSNGGRNALDFCIAYYIGVLSATDPNAFYHVISKDTGFDALLCFLNKRGISATRVPCIADISFLKNNNNNAPAPAPAPARLDVVRDIKIILNEFVGLISKDKRASLPARRETLSSTLIKSWFKNRLDPEQVDILIDKLIMLNYVREQNGKLVYSQ